MQCSGVRSATDPQLYGWSGILVWLACAGPAPMRGFPLHRGQASGIQCGDVCSTKDPQLYRWSGILVWLTCAGPAPMLGFPLQLGQACGLRRVFRNGSAPPWVERGAVFWCG